MNQLSTTSSENILEDKFMMIGKLAAHLNESRLIQEFSKFGTILNLAIIRSKGTGYSSLMCCLKIKTSLSHHDLKKHCPYISGVNPTYMDIKKKAIPSKDADNYKITLISRIALDISANTFLQFAQGLGKVLYFVMQLSEDKVQHRGFATVIFEGDEGPQNDSEIFIGGKGLRVRSSVMRAEEVRTTIVSTVGKSTFVYKDCTGPLLEATREYTAPSTAKEMEEAQTDPQKVIEQRISLIKDKYRTPYMTCLLYGLEFRLNHRMKKAKEFNLKKGMMTHFRFSRKLGVYMEVRYDGSEEWARSWFIKQDLHPLRVAPIISDPTVNKRKFSSLKRLKRRLDKLSKKALDNLDNLSDLNLI